MRTNLRCPVAIPLQCLFHENAFGCQSGGEQKPGTGQFRVALLTPGPISDGGWNASAYDGLQLIKKELGAEVSNVQTGTPSEFAQGFRDYAQQGYDLVFGHGFEFQDPALQVGAEFPRTAFVVSSGSVHGLLSRMRPESSGL